MSEEYLTKINKFFDLDHEYFLAKNNGKKNDTIVIVGNGPSLKEEYFDVLRSKKIDTFWSECRLSFF